MTPPRAVFIERDGVLNRFTRPGSRLVPERISDFDIVIEAILDVRKLSELGFLVFVVSNQPGITAGTLRRRDLDVMHSTLRHCMPNIHEIKFCPHGREDACPCHMPLSGMLDEVRHEYSIETPKSFLIGITSDAVKAGQRVGCTTIGIESQWLTTCHPAEHVGSLPEAVEKIKTLSGKLTYTIPAVLRGY